jgi:hypothetical protein
MFSAHSSRSLDEAILEETPTNTELGDDGGRNLKKRLDSSESGAFVIDLARWSSSPSSV